MINQPLSMKVAVAIPTYQREQVLLDTLTEVSQLNPPADEVIVVDQTEEHSAEFIQAMDAHIRSGMIRWIRQSPPNLPAARNRALLEAKSDIVLFLDDDVLLPDKNLIGHHLKGHAQAEVYAVTGAVLNRKLESIQLDPSRALELGPALPGNALVDVVGVPMLRGGNHSIRRQVALQLGGYDEQFLGSALAEDLDMAIRLGGRHIATSSCCQIIHLAAPAGGCRTTDRRASMPEWTRTVSAFIAIFRHGPRYPALIPIWLLTALRAGPLRRNVVLEPAMWPKSLLGLLRAISEGLVRAPRPNRLSDSGSRML